MYIVLEYLLLENFIINFLILYINRILIRDNTKTIRLIIGSAIASLYSLIFFYPALEILANPISKILLSMVIIRISFNYSNLRVFLKELMGFYIISFIFAGATIGIFYSSGSLNSILNTKVDLLNGFPVKYLVIGVVISIIMAKAVFQYFHLRSTRENYIAAVTISYNGQIIQLSALLDTGHSLRDPFTKKGILIIEYEKLREYLPEKTWNLLIANEENNYKEVEDLLNKLQKEISITIIPFKSIGRSGMLFAFRPDSVTINYLNKETKREDLLIGIYSGSLSKEMGYSGLLNYELINGGVEHEYNSV